MVNCLTLRACPPQKILWRKNVGDELAGKLHREEITEEEAREFLAALLERREQAIREKGHSDAGDIGRRNHVYPMAAG